MSFDGLFLHASKQIIADFLPAKINKIQGVSESDVLFHLRGERSEKLLISLHSQYNRIHFTHKSYTTFDFPSNFIMVLRKHIDGGILESIEQIGLDRAFKFTIKVRNELGDLLTRYMYVELMGKYANLILVDEQNKIIDAIKRIPPFLENVRTIHPGATFIEVSQQDKQNPFCVTSIDPQADLQKQYFGFSKVLVNEVLYRLPHQSFTEIMNELKHSKKLYVYENNKLQFHIIPLTHLAQTPKIFGLMEGIDYLFDEIEEKERIRQQTGDLYKVVKKELKKNRTKLPKLFKTLENAIDNEKYREYGDLLFSYMYRIEKGAKFTILPSFEDESEIRIDLDPKLDVKGNANKYYSLYHKSKTAIIEMEKQIEQCQAEIDYLESIETQLEYANFKDAQEIRQELVDHHLLAPTSNRLRKTKGKVVPNFLKFNVDGVLIYVGKNNIQNDYITFQLARKNHTWLHAKDIHGAHVLILDEQPSEHVLRMAAQLASYYSKARLSSSVPVNYTSMKNIKKPSKRVLGLVYLQNYKTIYIDPEPEIIENLLKHHQVK